MQIVQTYLNDPRVVAFRASDAYPYVRGLALASGIALTVSLVAAALFAAGPLLLSLSKASFVIAEWSLIASGIVTVGYYMKGYLEKFYELVQAKIESILNTKK